MPFAKIIPGICQPQIEDGTRTGFACNSPCLWGLLARPFLKVLLGACIFTAAGCFSATAAETSDAIWPQFRGVQGNGLGAGHYPVFFGPQSNVLWKTALPLGHSSPCIWKDRIFLTAFSADQLQTLCLDRASGKILWQQSVAPQKVERSGRLSNPAASTPATDGQQVYVYFGSFGLISYDFSGKELWRTPLPVPVTQHGASASPVLAQDKVIMIVDQDIHSHLLAVWKKDGQTAWKTERPGFRRSFSTPLVIKREQREEIIVAGTLKLMAYDIQTGRETWSVQGLPNEMCSTPILANGQIYTAGWTPGAGPARLGSFDSLLQQGDKDKDGKIANAEAPSGPAKQHFPYIDANKDGFITRDEWESMATIFAKSENALLAMRPGTQGDATDTNIVWKQKKGLPYVPSPLYFEGFIYLVKNGGLFSCFNATNGTPRYQEERLDAMGDFYASPVAADGRVYVASQQGMVVVIAPGEALDVLARNRMGEEIMATPALVEDTIYLRTSGHLYAFKQ